MCIIIAVSGLVIIQVEVFSTTKKQNDKQLSFNYTSHNPITISNDDDFIDYGFPGLGTAEDPYLIENYNITTNSEIGIYIEDTTKYFVIRNCYIDAYRRGIDIENTALGTTSIINNICFNNQYGFGIKLYQASFATIINNTCINSRDGIHVHTSSGVTLANNTCINNDYQGIKMEYAFNATIINNNCSDNRQYGIHLWRTFKATLKNNTLSNNDAYGINLRESSSATLTNNTFNNNNDFGIYFDSSPGATLANNSFYNNELYLVEESVEEYSSYTIENNWLNDKLLGFYLNINNVTFPNPIYSQLIFINCTELFVCNQELSNLSIGLSLKWCENVTVSNNIFKNNKHYGIYLSSSSGTILTNNTFYNDGVFLGEDSVEDYLTYTVENNWVNGRKLGFFINLNDVTFSDSIYGQLIFINCSDIDIFNQELSNITTGLSLKWCKNTKLTNNICNNNSIGIQLEISSGLTLTNNTCRNNRYCISLVSSSNNALTKNICKNNMWGIRLVNSDFCLLTYNLLQENEEYGIAIEDGSDNNIIHHNTFNNNNLGGTSQALDNGENNTWYDVKTKEGNYWSNWIQKEPYLIDGTSGSIDPYPLYERLKRAKYFYILIILPVILLTVLYAIKRKKKIKNQTSLPQDKV